MIHPPKEGVHKNTVCTHSHVCAHTDTDTRTHPSTELKPDPPVHSAGRLQILAEAGRGGSNFQVHWFLDTPCSRSSPTGSSSSECAGDPPPALGPFKRSTVHPTLLKMEESETKCQPITEVLITAKHGKPCCEKLSYIEATTTLCLSSTKLLGC